MRPTEIHEYLVRQKSKNIAETPWLELPGDNKISRRLAKVHLVRDILDPAKFVGLHLELAYQRRKRQSEEWPSDFVNLRSWPGDAGFKIVLDTAQTRMLLEALTDGMTIGGDDISSGRRSVIKGAKSDQIVVADSGGKAEIIQLFSEALTGEEIGAWLEHNPQFVPANLALLKLYQERLQVLQKFGEMITEDWPETEWQKFLAANRWIFGVAYISIISERRIDIRHQADFPLEVDGGFMDVAEIKKPSWPFWTQTRAGADWLYRGKFLVPNLELSAAISQVSHYILQAEKNVTNSDYIKDHGGIVPLKPRVWWSMAEVARGANSSGRPIGY